MPSGKEARSRLPVRVLVIVLVVQFVFAGAAIYFALEGWPFVGGGRHAQPLRPRPATQPVAAPAAAVVPAARVDRFDGARALATARALVALGPRPAGSPGARAASEMLRPLLPGGRFEDIPGHPGLRNIVGRVGGTGKPIVVIAHYDTTPVPGYVGANNSAAAVGTVVEIARRLRRAPGGPPVVFLLTDGEEAPDYPPQDFAATALRGSKAAAAGVLGRTARSVIVLDFVGQRGLRIPREAASDKGLWSRLRAAAASVGVGAVFPAGTRGAIMDDHTPFRDKGIPAIDLIDFDYPCWQRTCDTLDKLSVRSIDASGEAVTELLRRER